MNFEINITAYKYELHVNNLIEVIRKSRPYFYIRVWDNSPKPLRIYGANEVRWNRFNPSLSRVWNWGIAQSQTQWVLLANDDIELSKDWYEVLLSEIANYRECLWHGPSRFFLFNKHLLDVVGWFDERFTDFTHEDLDYIRRMHHANVPICYGKQSIIDKVAKSLKHTVDRPHTYTKNKLWFDKKYNNNNKEVFNDPPLILTEDFYPCRPK